MANIIALQGAGNRGKTRTIRILYRLLLANGYQVIHTNFREDVRDASNFRAELVKNGIRIGVTSIGDLYQDIFRDLGNFIAHGCSICVCACHSSDRRNANGMVQGTIAAVRSFPTHPPIFIAKTVNQVDRQNLAQNLAINTADAQRLFNEIEARA